jgi:23S rRNA pseudouridine2605 synthase
LILQSRVAVDGQVVRQLGTRVDVANARITVDGEPIRIESTVYFAVNKPKGYVSTNSDPSGRPRVVDLLPEIPERVYTVGRLDEDSTGLLILTNDGELANKLAHPRYGVEKIYRALVAGLPGPELMAKLTEGVWLSDGKVRAKRARIVGRQGQATQLELVLGEGKKREIRRMLAKLGHKVMSLTRIAIGPVSLKRISPGDCRPLSRHEVDLLRKVASGVAFTTPPSADGEFSRESRGPHDHRSTRPRRQSAGQSPNKNSPARHGPGPRRFRDNDAATSVRSSDLSGRHASASEGALRAHQTGPRKKRPAGSTGGSPAQAGGSKRPTTSTTPAAQPPRVRRIIGLEPEPPAGGRQGAGRRSVPKRPPPRKPRLRLHRPGKRPLRTSADRIDEIDGEDAS